MQEYVPLYAPEAKKGLSGDTIFSWLIVLVGIGLFIYFLGEGNGLGLALSFISAFVLFMVAKPLLRLFDPELDAENRVYLLRLIGWTVFFLLVVFGPAFLLQQWLLPWFIESLNLRFHQQLILLIVFSLPFLWLMMYLYALVPHYYINQPATKGDFETSLRRGASLNRLMSRQMNVMFAYGWLLLLAGRWVEAEKHWRDFIQEHQNAGFTIVSSALINLAASLAGQGHYDEAKPLLEAAVKIRPEYGVVYRELGQWYLENHESPQRALELSEMALHFTKKPRFTFAGQAFSWLATLASHAFALAANGKEAEARAYLERAFTEIQDRDVFTEGFLRLYAGRVYAALGEAQKAKAYYQEAMALHPSYSVHPMAVKALQELDAALT
jgi:tetratricopeptide (TPR) repeat protein